MESESMTTGMYEYVAREEIRRAYEKLTRSYVNGDPYIADWRFDEMIENLHASDVAPVRHGRWIDAYPDIEPNPMFIYGICSECGFEQGISKYLDYCPNCGAKMDGGAN